MANLVTNTGFFLITDTGERFNVLTNPAQTGTFKPLATNERILFITNEGKRIIVRVVVEFDFTNPYKFPQAEEFTVHVPAPMLFRVVGQPINYNGTTFVNGQELMLPRDIGYEVFRGRVERVSGYDIPSENNKSKGRRY